MALRYGLPSDLSGSLRRLDDGQLDGLLRAAIAEARRRGRLPDAIASPEPPGAKKAPARAAPSGAKAAGKPPLPPGQAKVIRAALEAGVKPAAIARQFRVSRAQVERIAGERRDGG